ERVFKTIDTLLGKSRPEMALAITTRLLRSQPRDWEALFREGIALAMTDKPAEAAARFRALLDLRLADDEPSAAAKARKKAASAGRPAGTSARQTFTPADFPLQQRIDRIWELRRATGMDGRPYYGGPNGVWMPGDFGQARMAALGWLFTDARRQNQ